MAHCIKHNFKYSYSSEFYNREKGVFTCTKCGYQDFKDIIYRNEKRNASRSERARQRIIQQA